MHHVLHGNNQTTCSVLLKLSCPIFWFLFFIARFVQVENFLMRVAQNCLGSTVSHFFEEVKKH